MSITLAQALPDQTLATHPEAIGPGAVMNAQADVIFDIPARAGAPPFVRSTTGGRNHGIAASRGGRIFDGI